MSRDRWEHHTDNLATYRYMRDERQDVTMTCGRVLSTNHSEIMPAFKWLTARPAVTAGLESDVQPRQRLCFIILSHFLALNSQVACGTNKHPLPASNYKAHVLLIKNHYYGWWLATRMNWSKYQVYIHIIRNIFYYFIQAAQYQQAIRLRDGRLVHHSTRRFTTQWE